MSRVIHFIELRRTRLPLKRCWQMAGLQNATKKAANIAAFILCAVGCLYLMSDAANALGTASDNQSAAIISKQKADIEALTKIVATCLSDDHTGKPLKIGDEWFLCGLSPLGSYK